MAKKARSEEQTLRALHQAESGQRVADICREHGVKRLVADLSLDRHMLQEIVRKKL
jgi:hypothetical protein